MSALRPLELPCIDSYSGLHLAIPAHRGFVEGDPRLRDGYRFHRIEEVQGVSLVAPIATVLDHLGMCASPLGQLAAIDAALHEGRLSLDDIRTFSATPLRRTLWLASNAEPLTQSPRETKARIELIAAGYAVEPQAELPGVGHVDFLVESTVVVECDGFTYHGDEEAFIEDRRRDRACELLGYRRLRYTGSEVEQSRGRIAADVRRMLAERG
ncbi:endonuclease domain-containing protein [Demequina sp.]|uniref:endonuclease domain-containing protein n=1 Tax=Demequina sp. TaxID=2050685 RepID=UPI003D10A290